MDEEILYELIGDAVKAAFEAESGGQTPRLSNRMVEGVVHFEDAQGRVAKTIPVTQLFRKVTSVREKLRVLEQKVNNHGGLNSADKAELQAYITKCYGSLTTFNFLFRDDADRFKGTGG